MWQRHLGCPKLACRKKLLEQRAPSSFGSQLVLVRFVVNLRDRFAECCATETQVLDADVALDCLKALDRHDRWFLIL